MIKLYKKTSRVRASIHLPLSEIVCKCNYSHCKHVIVVDELNDCYERLRMLCGDGPLYVTCGNRCSQHNLDEGGADCSQHLPGFALDIVKPKHIMWKQFEEFCYKAGFSKVIIYRLKNFAHCDIRGLI